MNRYRVQIDRKLCCGTSNCAEVAPEAFQMDDNAQPHLIVPLAADEVLLAGAQACPMCAIEVYDTQTGTRIYP